MIIFLTLIAAGPIAAGQAVREARVAGRAITVIAVSTFGTLIILIAGLAPENVAGFGNGDTGIVFQSEADFTAQTNVRAQTGGTVIDAAVRDALIAGQMIAAIANLTSSVVQARVAMTDAAARDTITRSRTSASALTSRVAVLTEQIGAVASMGPVRVKTITVAINGIFYLRVSGSGSVKVRSQTITARDLVIGLAAINGASDSIAGGSCWRPSDIDPWRAIVITGRIEKNRRGGRNLDTGGKRPARNINPIVIVRANAQTFG
jgi:hypothetical protein